MFMKYSFLTFESLRFAKLFASFLLFKHKYLFTATTISSAAL